MSEISAESIAQVLEKSRITFTYYNSRQPWALEMLVKVLKQVMTSKNTSTMFKSACHADLKNILPDMAQLQWTLHGNAGIKMISSCPSCQYLGQFLWFFSCVFPYKYLHFGRLLTALHTRPLDAILFGTDSLSNMNLYI